MSNQNTYLLLLTIGPVQSFIAQARKTVDLFAGSRILTELTKVGIEQVGENNIIFPCTSQADWKKVNSLPNRFVAELIGTAEEIEQLGIAAENAIRIKFKAISEKALDKAGLQNFPAYEQQIEQHLEIFWSAIPFAEDYKTTYQRLEQVIGSLKNVRNFSQYTYNGLGEIGRKCSIDGERNAIIFRENVKDDGIKTKPFALCRDAQSTHYKLEEGEAISAVSYIKRAYESKQEFPSTSTVALMHVGLVMKEDKDGNESYEKISNWNDQLFFKENVDSNKFIQKVLRESNIPDSKEADIKNTHKRFWKLAEEKGFSGSTNNKYYAVLTFDGDSMGKWLGGDFVVGDLKQFHKDFSIRLSEFAKLANDIIKKSHKGDTIYAGGDDYLGFLNINYLFDVLTDLQVEYKKAVSDPLLPYRKDGKEITFSAGICIAHYKEPLRLVLQEAHKMMDKAKESQDDKNSFGISVIKGSGETLETIWKNNNIDSLRKITLGLIDKEKRTYFSDKYINVLQTEFKRLANAQNSLDNDELLKIELKRTLKRAVNNGEKAQKEEAVKKINNTVWGLYEANKQINGDIDNFFSALNFCRFMQRELCKRTLFEPTKFNN
jgi:CRISPR-associated protein Cmr2